MWVDDMETDEAELRHDRYRERLILDTAREQVRIRFTVHELEWVTAVYAVYAVNDRLGEVYFVGTLSDVKTRDDVMKDLRAWFKDRGLEKGFDIALGTEHAPRLNASR